MNMKIFQVNIFICRISENKNILLKIPKSTKKSKEEIKSFKSFQYYKIHSYNCRANNFFDEIFERCKYALDVEAHFERTLI